MNVVSPLVIASALALKKFDNDALLALSLALMNGVVDAESYAYEPALKSRLIAASGRPHDLESLSIACASEIEQRVGAGTLS